VSGCRCWPRRASPPGAWTTTRRWSSTCAAAGSTSRRAFAAEHLAALPDGALDAVTAFHVVEHLDLESTLALLAHTARVLRPGGLLVLETPHPANLVMGACNFYLDPTHRSPVPPARLEFLAAASGFTDVRVWELHPKEDVDLSGLRLNGVGAAETALLAAALQKGLFGPQDYALLARASG
jgi:SAM-dependent methyltransferase